MLTFLTSLSEQCFLSKILHAISVYRFAIALIICTKLEKKKKIMNAQLIHIKKGYWEKYKNKNTNDILKYLTQELLTSGSLKEYITY